MKKQEWNKNDDKMKNLNSKIRFFVSATVTSAAMAINYGWIECWICDNDDDRLSKRLDTKMLFVNKRDRKPEQKWIHFVIV